MCLFIFIYFKQKTYRPVEKQWAKQVQRSGDPSTTDQTIDSSNYKNNEQESSNAQP